MLTVREVVGGVTIAVQLQPGAKREGVLGLRGENVMVATAAPAMDGRANESLVQCLAALLQVPRMGVTILSGHTSQSKVVRVDGITSEQMMRCLGRSSSESQV